jgi:hypothetical protein
MDKQLIRENVWPANEFSLRQDTPMAVRMRLLAKCYKVIRLYKPSYNPHSNTCSSEVYCIKFDEAVDIGQIVLSRDFWKNQEVFAEL